jgi:hypothetical protein
MPERRTYARYVIWFPVTLRTHDLEVGTICRDASSGGLLVSSPVEIMPETSVTCEFRLSLEAKTDLSAMGVLVRAERNANDLELVFPFLLAVAFDPPRADIEEMLRHAEKLFRESR